MIKTEHIFYINSNTRYCCQRDDCVEFESAISKLHELGSGPFGVIRETIGIDDYIIGMYPEFEKALKFFHDEFYKYPDGAKNDELMYAKAKVAMRKFGLNTEYDFDCEPNKEQLRRLNERIKPKQRNDSSMFASGFLKDLAFVVIDVCDDYRQSHQFLSTINVLETIISEKCSEEHVRMCQDIDGVEMGLEFLSLKKQGLIDDSLKITDIDKFCDSKLIKEFKIGDKVYDLSENLMKLYGKTPNKNINSYQRLNNRF